MADVFAAEKRSEIMSRVRGAGNAATELRFVHLLRSAGIAGWRRKVKLFGKPDFVFREQRVCVFLDGCFWHGCSLHWTCPDTNRVFWLRKISANRRRDRLVANRLRRAGWTVMRVWQHELKEPVKVMKRLRSALAKGQKERRRAHG